MLDARDAALRCALLALLGGALCAFSWPGRTERLVAELRAEREPRARSDLVRLLGASGDDAARDAVLEAARDRDPNVRAEALAALAKLTARPVDARAPAREPAVDARAPAREQAVDAREQADDDATRETVVALLSDTAPHVRAAAAEALGRLSSRTPEGGIDLLLRSLSDEDPKVRAASARALGTLRAGRAVAALGRTLSDASLEVATAAADALAEEGSSHALGLLASKLGLAPPELRVTILDAVHGGWPTLAHKLAHLALADESTEVVLAGLRLVLRLRLGESLDQVEALAHVDDARLAAAARSAAHELRAAGAEQHSPRAARPTWLEPLLRAGDPATLAAQQEEVLSALEASLPVREPLAAEPLAEWLLRAPHGLRARIATLLASTGVPARADALQALLDEPDTALRIALCDVFAHTRDPRYSARLEALLWAHDLALREAAARALGAIADRDTLEQLRKTLARGPAGARPSAAHALALALERLRGELGKRALRRLHRTLLETLRAGDEPSAARAARALGVLDAYAATDALRRHGAALSTPRELALLRASARDGSPSARALRARYSERPEAALAATALTAQVLAREREPRELLQLTAGARWPLGPIAAFGLARAATGSLRALDVHVLCDAAQSSAEPTTRHNLRVALERLQVTCRDLPRKNPLSHALDGALPDAFQSLVFADGSVLITALDAAHDASWRTLRHLFVADPWQCPYGTKR